jgi:hypothetical protein
MRRYEQLQLRANSLREELHTEIERMLDDIVRFKLHVQKNLEDYEQFIAARSRTCSARARTKTWSMSREHISGYAIRHNEVMKEFRFLAMAVV